MNGCVRGDNRGDEERDPHFQRGCSLASSQDFKHAAEEFEKALDTNPHSAAAHLKLGGLYDTQLPDYAAAIYHYEQYLQSEPDSKNAALVQERIRGCKQLLANAEFPLPHSKDLQKDVDRLTAENQGLRQQIEALKAQLANAGSAGQYQTRALPQNYTTAANPNQTQQSASAANATRSRVHVVKAHETISSIAAQYGLKASQVLAANPHTDPRRLRVGQSLNLP